MNSRIPCLLAAGTLLASTVADASYLVDTGTPAIGVGTSTLNFRAGQFTVTETVTIGSVEHWAAMPGDADVRLSIRGNSTCTTMFGTNPCPSGNLDMSGDLYSAAFELVAACQVRIEWVPSDPSSVIVYPIPDYCAAGLQLALAAILAALLKAGFVIR